MFCPHRGCSCPLVHHGCDAALADIRDDLGSLLQCCPYLLSDLRWAEKPGDIIASLDGPGPQAEAVARMSVGYIDFDTDRRIHANEYPAVPATFAHGTSIAAALLTLHAGWWIDPRHSPRGIYSVAVAPTGAGAHGRTHGHSGTYGDDSECSMIVLSHGFTISYADTKLFQHMDLDIPAGVILSKKKQPLPDFIHSPASLQIKALVMNFTQLRALLHTPGALRLAIQKAMALTGIPPPLSLVVSRAVRCSLSAWFTVILAEEDSHWEMVVSTQCTPRSVTLFCSRPGRVLMAGSTVLPPDLTFAQLQITPRCLLVLQPGHYMPQPDHMTLRARQLLAKSIGWCTSSTQQVQPKAQPCRFAGCA